MRYELMRPSQIREAIKKRTPVVLPLGVLEYHSEHLPVGMDTLAVERALHEYEKEAEVVILPSFYWGASSRAVAPCEGRGSIPVDSQALVPIARQIFRGLLDVGFRNIHTFVHHQSEDFAAGMPTDLAFRLASRQVIMEFLEEKKGDGWWGDPSSASYYTDHTNLDANPFIWIQNHALMDAKVLEKYPFDHAGEGETSLMMSLCPDTVNMDEFDKTAWYAQSALKASKETGDNGVRMILDHFRRIFGKVIGRKANVKRILALLSVAALSALTTASADVVVENARFKLVLGDNACAKSLVVKATGEEMLDPAEDIPAFSVIQDRPFNNEVKLVLPHGRTEFRADRVRRMGNDLFVGFELISYEAQIRLTERPDYVLFELVDFPLGPKGSNRLKMTYPPVAVMKILNLPVKDRAHFGTWLNVSWDDRSALSLFAAEPYTLIGNAARHGFHLMTAEAHRGVRVRGAKAVLMASATPDFMDAMDAAEAELGLPRGAKSRHDPRMDRSIYWTIEISPETVDQHIELAKRGGFTKMLIYHTAVTEQKCDYPAIADYKPDLKNFPKGYESIREMLAKLKAAGIMPGLHVLQTFIGFNTHYVTPVADSRLNLKRHFTLAKPFGADAKGDLFVQEDPSDSPTNAPSRILAFGGELFAYEGFTTERPYKFTGVTRGAKKTNVVAHPQGQIGGVLDVCEYCAKSCYIDQNTDLQDEIAAKIAKIYDCGFEFMYNDGSEGASAPYEIHVANAQYRVWRRLAKKPLFMEGAAKSHFGWHHQSGANAFDVFPPEIFKAMIVRWPLYEAPIMRQDFSQLDFGWWRCYLPSAKTVGTQLDMWEFGTSKAAAWDCPMSIQMHPGHVLKHPRVDDLLAVVRRWEDVRAKKWLTSAQRGALRDAKREFHLLETVPGAYELCEIEMLPTPAGAKHLRGFLFERGGKRVVACWHTAGEGMLDWTLGPKGTLSGLKYVTTDLSREEVKAAWMGAKLGDVR